MSFAHIQERKGLSHCHCQENNASQNAFLAGEHGNQIYPVTYFDSTDSTDKVCIIWQELTESAASCCRELLLLGCCSKNAMNDNVTTQQPRRKALSSGFRRSIGVSGFRCRPWTCFPT
jgi:hypothetical protein